MLSSTHRARALLEESAAVHHRLASLADDVARLAAVCTTALRNGGQLLFFGNGGSAADAQHLAAEFVGRFRRERPAFPAIALTTDTSALTAIGNDYGFDHVFERQVEAHGRPGDVAIGFSTSGNSPNVLRALEAAKARGLRTAGFTGRGGGLLAGVADLTFCVPADDTARIQESHITLGHVLCELVEAALTVEDYRRDEPVVFHSQTRDRLATLREAWRQAGDTVVWTNGCFDLLHAGHVSGLVHARQFGERLIVGVNTDASVRRLKGPSRPVVPAEDRAKVLAALECVDAVILFEGDTPEPEIEALRPDVFCKGAEYARPGGLPVPEAKIVEGYGGRVAYLPLLEGRSTSDLIDRVIGLAYAA